MVVPWKAVGMVVLVLIGAGSAWQFQDWRYGHHLAEQARLHAEVLNQLTQAAATAQQAEQDKPPPPRSRPSRTSGWRSSSGCRTASRPTSGNDRCPT